MKFLWITIGLAVVMTIPFLLWDDTFTRLFSGDEMVAWLRARGGFGWAAGILLLVSDLFLPIPGTAVMAALGFVYGPLVGGIVSVAGSFLSGMAAYGLCRAVGHRAALRLVGADDLAKGERLFARSGGWIVALSRCLPLLPEVIACLAGLARMPLRNFSVALACGAIPMGFVFAGIGSLGEERPGLAIGLSLALPPVLWLLAGHLMGRRPPGPTGGGPAGGGESKLNKPGRR
jgi:uncharacterized membrane protein YdjX (TVP38/TMEM64 family)